MVVDFAGLERCSGEGGRPEHVDVFAGSGLNVLKRGVVVLVSGLLGGMM